MGFVGKINTYTCQTCGWKAITKDVDEGVTPFLIRCEGECKNAGDLPAAQSSMYRVDQTLTPTHEWYRPSPADTPEYAREHVQRGGLLLRKVQPITIDEGLCAACPQEVRGLYAVAFNLLNLLGSPERFQRKFAERMGELQAAVNALTPMIETHFQNQSHAAAAPASAPAESFNAEAAKKAALMLQLVASTQKAVN